MIYQKRSSTLRKISSFLVSFFLGILVITGLFSGTVHADPPIEQTGDTQLSEDIDPPVVTTNLSDGQVLSGTVPIIETVYETNPLEYAIKITNVDGTDVVVDGAPVGAVQNPATEDELRFDWDTTLVANGNYQVVFKAIDQSGNSQTLPIQVTVNNLPEPPAYPPITSELTPIPEQALTLPRKTSPPKVSSPANTAQSADILGAKTNGEQLAQRLQNPAVVMPELQKGPADACATLFGVCWYYSVPTTLVMSAAAVWFYRFRSRE